MSPTSVVQTADAVPVRAPAPGVAMLACRCGQVLDAAQLCRAPRPPLSTGHALQRIVCPGCAGLEVAGAGRAVGS